MTVSTWAKWDHAWCEERTSEAATSSWSLRWGTLPGIWEAFQLTAAGAVFRLNGPTTHCRSLCPSIATVDWYELLVPWDHLGSSRRLEASPVLVLPLMMQCCGTLEAARRHQQHPKSPSPWRRGRTSVLQIQDTQDHVCWKYKRSCWLLLIQCFHKETQTALLQYNFYWRFQHANLHVEWNPMWWMMMMIPWANTLNPTPPECPGNIQHCVENLEGGNYPLNIWNQAIIYIYIYVYMYIYINHVGNIYIYDDILRSPIEFQVRRCDPWSVCYKKKTHSQAWGYRMRLLSSIFPQHSLSYKMTLRFNNLDIGGGFPLLQNAPLFSTTASSSSCHATKCHCDFHDGLTW